MGLSQDEAQQLQTIKAKLMPEVERQRGLLQDQMQKNLTYYKWVEDKICQIVWHLKEMSARTTTMKLLKKYIQKCIDCSKRIIKDNYKGD